MQIQDAISLLRARCALRHTALKTEKSYGHWLMRYAGFLKGPQPNPLATTEQKVEAFLTSLALAGVSASTQNQAFNALLFFYRYALKQELLNINSLRAKRPAALRHCPAREEALQLLAHVDDVHNYDHQPSVLASLRELLNASLDDWLWDAFALLPRPECPGRNPEHHRTLDPAPFPALAQFAECYP